MQNLKEISKQYKLGTTVYYLADGVIHIDAIASQHKFQYAIEDHPKPHQDTVNIGDNTYTVQESLLVVLAFSHRIYSTDKVYIPIDIKNQHKIRLIDKLYLSRESLLNSIQMDIDNSTNAITQTPV